MKLSNTLTNSLDTLRPLTNDRVKIYTCGLTVYSQPHIGNWLGYIYWDVLIRALLAEGYEVERTQNITDVGHLVSDDDSGEDKMEKGARKEGMTAWDVAKKYSLVAEHEAYDLLGLIRPNHLVTATSYIDKQIDFAKILDKKGYLYRTDDGMYFDTSKLTDYGKLAKLDSAGLEAGARVEMAGKKNPTDFAVWKFSPTGQKRDMEWGSPWGKGFPGWHLECSVIARETLGDQIDIHAGGIDHIPVHHTNEIAQTESVTGVPFATIWIHNNHIKVNGTKIAKSLGNIYTLADISKKGFSMDDFKLMTLAKHYRTEGNFTWDILNAAHNRMQHWREAAVLRWQISTDSTGDHSDIRKIASALNEELLTALNDNLNTPAALMLVDRMVDTLLSQPISKLHTTTITDLFEKVDQLLGFRIITSTPDMSETTKPLITAREQSRHEKDWQRSDQLRDELISRGIGVNDSVSGSRWYWL